MRIGEDFLNASINSNAALALRSVNAVSNNMDQFSRIKNLKIINTIEGGGHIDHQLTITADVVLFTYNVIPVNVSVVVDMDVSGLNGLDTGSVAANTWYYIWLISNGTTTGAVFSLESDLTNVLLPTGYIHGLRVGAIRTVGAPGCDLIPIVQIDKTVVILKTLVIQSGTSGLYQPVSLDVAVPVIAKVVSGWGYQLGTTASCFLAANEDGAGEVGWYGTGICLTFQIPMIEPSTMYYRIGATGPTINVYITGWGY